MILVRSIVRPEKVDAVMAALMEAGFPAVTKCRVCDETVWEWQRHERMEFKTVNTGSLVSPIIQSFASGIVHTKCAKKVQEGELDQPKFEYEVKTK